MKKVTLLTLGTCLVGLSLASFTVTAEEIDTEKSDIVTSTENNTSFSIRKEFPIQSKEDDGATNGKTVNLISTSLNLHGVSNYDNYLRFTNISLPQDAILKSGSLIFTAKSASTKPTEFTIQGEIGDNAPFSKSSESFTNRTFTDNNLVVQTPSNVALNDRLETDNILPIIDEMISNNKQGNDFVFKLKGNATGRYIAKSFDADPDSAPKLVLTYESKSNDLSIPISSATDTAKELIKTKKTSTIGNLELGGYKAAPSEANKQSIGLRFSQVEIPENAEIEEAYIDFVTATPSAKQATANLDIKSELGNAESYTNSEANISSRHYSQLTATTKMENLKKRGDHNQTTDISDLINESRLNGWKSGEALAFKIDGDNFLGSVYSFDKANSPRLVVKYKQSDTPLLFKNMITENKDIKDVYINEISTEGTVASKESWIELYNKNDKPVLLNKDITLVQKKKKFDLAGIIIPANSYRIIYMDDNNKLGNDHSTFELSGSGNLSLIDNSQKEKRTIDSIDYEKHAYNQTVGRKPDGSQNVLVINEPTFEATNNEAKTDSSLHFNKDRGVYPEGFDLNLSADPSLTIRYTTDGSEPTTTKGTVYTKPITVNKTTVVKAIAYSDTTKTGVNAHSYVLENNYQNEMRKGAVWQFKENISSDEYAKGIKEFPIVSVTSDKANLTTEDANGTFEYIDAHTGKGHGNYFSYSANKKFGQVSASQYNAGVATKFNRNALTKKAKYQFFEEFPNDNYPVVKKFAKLELKEGQDGPQNDIYGLGYNRYDEKVTNTLAKQMGKIALSSRYVNYFYNGQYFGVKTLREDFGEKMFEEYFGGNDDAYTKIRFQDAAFATGNVEDKTNTVWKTIQEPIKNKDFQEIKKYIDIDDLINTQILFMFVDTEREIDAVVENSVLENNAKAVKMKFNVNDTDGAFHNNNLTGTSQAPLAGGGGTYRYKWNVDTISKQGAGKVFGTFSGNSTNEKLGNLEFKTMVKDRVAQQFGTFNEGKNDAPLTVDNVQHLIKQNVAELNTAYKLDAAFMGARKTMYQDWLTQQEKILKQVPDRVTFSQEMWKKYNMAHTLEPVQVVEKDNQKYLFSSSQKATIYYTTDGTDPMGEDGVISKSAIKYSKETLPSGEANLTIRAFEPNNWGPLVVK